MFYAVALIAPRFWSPIHDNAFIWFNLAEGILLPLSLYLTDPCFRDSVKSSFKRRTVYASSLTKKESVLTTKSAFGGHFNEFVLIDKPYDTLNKSPLKCNSSTLNLAKEKPRSLQLNNVCITSNANDYHNYQNDYYPYVRKSKVLRNDSQVFTRQFPRDELIYQKAAVNPFCKVNQIVEANEKSTLQKIGLNNTRIWRGNPLWRDPPMQIESSQFPAIGVHIADEMYSDFDRNVVEEKQMEAKCKNLEMQRSAEELLSEGLNMSLDAFAVSANEDFEYRDARNGKANGNKGDESEENFSEDESNSDDATSILSSDSCSSIDTEPLYDNLNFSKVIRNAGDCKRKGWQCFSASDLHLIDSTAANLSPLSADGELNKKVFSSRRTLSETNLLQTNCERFLNTSFSRIKAGDNESSESVNSRNSRSTNASWFQNKVIEAFKKRNGLNSVRNRQNSVLKCRRQLRYKKNVDRRRRSDGCEKDVIRNEKSKDSDNLNKS